MAGRKEHPQARVRLYLEILEDRVLLNASFSGQAASDLMGDLAHLHNDLETSQIALLNAVQPSPTNTPTLASVANQFDKVRSVLTTDWQQTQQAAVHFAFAVVEVVHQEFAVLLQDADTLLDDLGIRLPGQHSSAASPQAPTIAVSPPPATSASRTRLKPLSSPPPPMVYFDPPVYYANEGSSAVMLDVAINTPSTQSVSVQYATSDGTAVAGKDYTTTSGTLTIPAEQTGASFSVPLLDDNAVNEPSTETFKVTLSNPSGATLANPSTATVEITEDTDGGSNLPPASVGQSSCNCGCTGQAGSLVGVRSTRTGPQIASTRVDSNEQPRIINKRDDGPKILHDRGPVFDPQQR